jgi:hypothetical protein
MEATHGAPMLRADLSAAMTRANNVEFNFAANHYLLNRKPEYLVYLYNVSEQTFEVSRSPILRRLVINGRKKGEKFTMVTSFPQPLLVPKGSPDSSEIDIAAQDTRRFVMDIVNPDNLGLDQDTVLDPKFVTSQGVDLGKKGVFWSLNNPPTEAEVEKAIKRMEKYYTYLIEQANTVQVSAPATLKDVLTPEHHFACDYFGEEHSWHTAKRSRPIDCPNCGDRIKDTVAFHKTSDGGLCVLDWKRTVASGTRTRQQAFEATGDPQFAPSIPVAPVAVSKPSVQQGGTAAKVPTE